MSKQPDYDIYVNPIFPEDFNTYKFLYYVADKDEHRSWHETLLSGTNSGLVPVSFEGVTELCSFEPEKAIPNIFLKGD